MMCLRIFLIVAILTPVPLLTHFVWPLSYCLKADICNHTWIPDCGMENISFVDYRLFIDECDMFEYNCDFNRTYELTNYSECFRANTGCPTYDKFYRMGNYKFVLDGKKMIYDPTRPTKRTKPPITDHQTAPSISVPSLPMRMLRGRRRYTPVPKLERMMKRERESDERKSWQSGDEENIQKNEITNLLDKKSYGRQKRKNVDESSQRF